MRSKNTFIFLIVAIVSFLVYWFFIRKKTVKTPAPTPASPETPSATMGEAVVTFKPDKDADEPEAYTEYDEGDTDWVDLSKNVEITLTWDNKAGFNNTTKIMIRRVIETGSGDQTTKKTYDHVIQRYDADGNEIAANKIFFTNFKSGLSYKIKHDFGNKDDQGNPVAYSVLGKNTYSIWYTLTDGRSAILTEDDDGDKKTLTDTFTIEDLSLTLEMVKKTERYVTPSSASDVEKSSAVSENYIVLISKNKATVGASKRYLYRRWVNQYPFDDWKPFRLDKALKTVCNTKKGYDTDDKNAFYLFDTHNNKYIAAKFHYDTNGKFTEAKLVCTKDINILNQTCIESFTCPKIKMVQDQYTKGASGDTKQYYSLRISDCNRENRTSWADTDRDDPENTRGTGDLKSTTEVYFVTDKTTGKLILKTQEQMYDEELRDGWHAFEMVNEKDFNENDDVNNYKKVRDYGVGNSC